MNHTYLVHIHVTTDRALSDKELEDFINVDINTMIDELPDGTSVFVESTYHEEI